MREKGIDPPQTLGVDQWDEYWIRWIKRLANVFPKTQTYSQVLTPVSVAPNTTVEQNFTVTGLNINDLVFINKPSLDAGVGVLSSRVSSQDTIAITYINATAGAIVPTPEIYKIVSIRL